MMSLWPLLTLLSAASTSAAFLTTPPAGCITRDVFGDYSVPERGGQVLPVHRYTLTSPSGAVQVQVVEYGATITSITVPDRTGRSQDVVLGYDTLGGFFSADNPYFGATVGRVANRVAGAQFVLDGVTYNLFKNVNNDSLHGGLRGFDKKLWSGRMEDGRVVLEYSSPDGEEGYPGTVNVTVTYHLTADNTLVIEYRAASSKRTPINLTNHVYFNLAGHGAGAPGLYNHTVYIAADKITESNEDQIVTGRLLSVASTPYDLRQPVNLGEAIKRTPNDGFDDNFVLPQGNTENNLVAEVCEPGSGRCLQVLTSQPGLQFYTTNSLTAQRGKAGQEYSRHGAFCLEAQNYPNAVNLADKFPNSVYGPGDEYHQVIKYKFVVPQTESGSS